MNIWTQKHFQHQPQASCTHPSPSWRPRIRLASCISLGITVTRLACSAHKLLYRQKQTREKTTSTKKGQTTHSWTELCNERERSKTGALQYFHKGL